MKTPKGQHLIMKNILSLLFFAALALPQLVYSQASNSTSGGRYVIICNTAGQFSETHILDSQTGRVWVERGQATANPHFVPCTYQLLDGRASLVPIDTEIANEKFTKEMSLR